MSYNISQLTNLFFFRTYCRDQGINVVIAAKLSLQPRVLRRHMAEEEVLRSNPLLSHVRIFILILPILDTKFYLLRSQSLLITTRDLRQHEQTHLSLSEVTFSTCVFFTFVLKKIKVLSTQDIENYIQLFRM